MIEGHHEAVHISAAGMSIPHPDKVRNSAIKGVNRQGFGHGGEDAYFYCEGKHGLFGMGVADGVFMWQTQGIDSGVMAQMLMRKAMDMIQRGVEDVYKGELYARANLVWVCSGSRVTESHRHDPVKRCMVGGGVTAAAIQM